ncbi:MAG: DUF2267 domain-containing protein [Pseudomonadota bacterium]
METLIANIVSKVGIDAGTARMAIGIIMNLFQQNASSDSMAALKGAMPGVESAMAEAEAASDAPAEGGGGGLLGGGLGGMVAGALGATSGSDGIMGALAKMQAHGLSIDQAKQVGEEVASYVREHAGEDALKDATSSIPGLSQLL